MPKKEDLRIVKTYKSLTNAMLTLLNRRNFEKITVNDICEEALVSRATFYAHFNNKYDLLRFWMADLADYFTKDTHNYTHKQMEDIVNNFISENSKIIKHLLDNANIETFSLFQDFFSSIIGVAPEGKEEDPRNIILSKFCTGGIIDLLFWHVKENISPDTYSVYTYLYKMVKSILEWNANQE